MHSFWGVLSSRFPPSKLLSMSWVNWNQKYMIHTIHPVITSHYVDNTHKPFSRLGMISLVKKLFTSSYELAINSISLSNTSSFMKETPVPKKIKLWNFNGLIYLIAFYENLWKLLHLMISNCNKYEQIRLTVCRK